MANVNWGVGLPEKYAEDHNEYAQEQEGPGPDAFGTVVGAAGFAGLPTGQGDEQAGCDDYGDGSRVIHASFRR